MNKVEKIKAEIERRLKIIEPNLPSREEFDKVADRNPGINSDFNIGEKMGAYTMLKKIEQFIDSLEEEPVSNDLEEAAHSYVDTTIEWFDSEGNPCCYPAFIAGAQWQKQQTVNKTCSWLSNIPLEDMTYKYDDFDTSEGWYKLIEDFKKAMEE